LRPDLAWKRTNAAAPSQTAAPGLTLEERLDLLTWINQERRSGIDAIEDLGSRSWPAQMTGSVIGIFRTGETTATWILVGQNGLWAVLTISSGAVSAVRLSLAEALATVSAALHGERSAAGCIGRSSV
jgi:hypothetical protein